MSEPIAGGIISGIGEFGLIARLESILGDVGVVSGGVGIGDDCATIPDTLLGIERGGSLVVTTDSQVEGVHFIRGAISPFDLGKRLVNVNLSDLAAMGAEPVFALLSLHLPDSLEVKWVEAVYSGIAKEAARYNFLIVGGNTTSANEVVIDMTLVGRVGGRSLLRDGAKIGDDIWVSGEIGGSYVGLQSYRGELALEQVERERYLQRHFLPQARLALGRELCSSPCITSCIDVSDGLLQDCLHIAERSKVKMRLDLERIPLALYSHEHSSLEHAQVKLRPEELLRGGEDYELLFTSSSKCDELLKERMRNLYPGDVFYCPKRIGRVTAVSLRGSVDVYYNGALWCSISEETTKNGHTSFGYSHF